MYDWIFLLILILIYLIYRLSKNRKTSDKQDMNSNTSSFEKSKEEYLKDYENRTSEAAYKELISSPEYIKMKMTKDIELTKALTTIMKDDIKKSELEKNGEQIGYGLAAIGHGVYKATGSLLKKKPDSPATELEKYFKLYKKGVLTEKEFLKKKRELLES